MKKNEGGGGEKRKSEREIINKIKWIVNNGDNMFDVNDLNCWDKTGLKHISYLKNSNFPKCVQVPSAKMIAPEKTSVPKIMCIICMYVCMYVFY